MCSRGPFKSFPSLFRSHTCGRCTRRDAGTSSPLETASVSNMRTSWVRAGRLVCCSEPQSPLCFYLEKRHWTWLHPVTSTHTVIVSKNVKRKKKNLNSDTNSKHNDSKIYSWRLDISGLRVLRCYWTSLLPLRLFYANNSFNSDSHCLFFTCLTPTCCTICC